MAPSREGAPFSFSSESGGTSGERSCLRSVMGEWRLAGEAGRLEVGVEDKGRLEESCVPEVPGFLAEVE